jgi:glutamate dehydrogenase
MTPTELVNAILKAPVDLLYNGGIGTYVKATSETHAQVGDRANDALRVNGRELRCKVVRRRRQPRLHAARAHRVSRRRRRINTDAIDNSAGVDTSDHEVNIKILLGLPIADGELTEKQRNTLLAEMTDDVAALVLRDNIFQTQVLSVTAASRRSCSTRRALHAVPGEGGRLNRAIEFLPSTSEIAERRAAGHGPHAPERAVCSPTARSGCTTSCWLAAARRSVGGDGAGALLPAALRERYRGYMPRIRCSARSSPRTSPTA